MDKKVLSGAAKRKIREAKAESDRRLLSKIPKLTDMFSVESTSGQSQGESSKSVKSAEIGTEEQQSEEIGDDFETDNESNICSTECSLQNVSIASGISTEQSSDAGSWNVKNNQSTLQAYWCKKGIIQFYLFRSRK